MGRHRVFTMFLKLLESHNDSFFSICEGIANTFALGFVFSLKYAEVTNNIKVKFLVKQEGGGYRLIVIDWVAMVAYDNLAHWLKSFA